MKYAQLKYDQFDKYLFEAKSGRYIDSKELQYIFKFENGYGASVVKNIGSYGNRQDLFELAVIIFVSEFEWELCYESKITDDVDVIGYLTNDDVLELLERIKNL